MKRIKGNDATPQPAAVVVAEVQGFASIEAAQTALTSVVRVMEGAVNRIKDFSVRLVVLCVNMKQVEAFIALESTGTAILKGMSENAQVLLAQGSKHYSDAVTSAKDGLKRLTATVGITEEKLQPARDAVTEAEDRAKAFRSAQASLAHYRAEVKRYCALLLEGNKKAERSQSDKHAAIAESLGNLAARIHRLEGNYALAESTVLAVRDTFGKGVSLIDALRRLVAMQDAGREADKKGETLK